MIGLADLAPVVQWAAPIASTVIITACTAGINRWIEQSKKNEQSERELREREREENRAWRESVDRMLKTHESFIAERDDWLEWRRLIEGSYSAIDEKLDSIRDATQTTMRTTLLHYAEKYLTRGWVTKEERASLWDMHRKYAALNANGYIDSYIERVMGLPDHEI